MRGRGRWKEKREGEVDKWRGERERERGRNKERDNARDTSIIIVITISLCRTRNIQITFSLFLLQTFWLHERTVSRAQMFGTYTMSCRLIVLSFYAVLLMLLFIKEACVFVEAQLMALTLITTLYIHCHSYFELIYLLLDPYAPRLPWDRSGR